MKNLYALFSVANKKDIFDLAKFVDQTHNIIATEGTAKTLKSAGIDVIEVSKYTDFPELLDGRVKSLHPKIHAGILAKDNEKHNNELKELKINRIDLVVCNLYDFTDAISQNPREENVVESIDIGGPTIIRSAAKNFRNVTVLVDPFDYAYYINTYPDINLGDRVHLAAKAFAVVSHYDIEISKYMNKISEATESFFEEGLDRNYFVGGELVTKLRYGENPHQEAAYYTSQGESFYLHISGPQPSYNNILDVSAGWSLVSEFDDPSCVIIKHRTPCGVATGTKLVDSYVNALNTDKTSAYGGVFCFNKQVDEQTARGLIEMFVDVVFAPDISQEALEVFKEKENLTVLKRNYGGGIIDEIDVVPSGFLVQRRDFQVLSNSQMHVVSKIRGDGKILEELKFAWKVVKHARSNAIVVTKNTRALGIGSGQTSRVDAVKHAIERAGEEVKGAVLASDGFFPFPDSIELAAKAGIKAIISPNGSIRDDEIIQTANDHNIVLVFTDIRAFKH